MSKLAIKTLRIVAEKHFNRDLSKWEKRSGLCWAAGMMSKVKTFNCVSTPEYRAVTKVIAKETGKWNRFLAPRGKKWNQRAMYALFLAESLENKSCDA